MVEVARSLRPLSSQRAGTERCECTALYGRVGG
jgi:hypothetical protein